MSTVSGVRSLNSGESGVRSLNTGESGVACVKESDDVVVTLVVRQGQVRTRTGRVGVLDMFLPAHVAELVLARLTLGEILTSSTPPIVVTAAVVRVCVVASDSMLLTSHPRAAGAVEHIVVLLKVQATVGPRVLLDDITEHVRKRWQETGQDVRVSC
jgi:hypothetical protein